MKKSRKKHITVSAIKKDISLFFSSEEAKVLKKDVAEWGLTGAVIAAVMFRRAPAALSAGNEAVPDASLGHSDCMPQTHTSEAAPYDEVCKCGGHNSYMNPPTHVDSTVTVEG